jgi:hypothetical protein
MRRAISSLHTSSVIDDAMPARRRRPTLTLIKRTSFAAWNVANGFKPEYSESFEGRADCRQRSAKGLLDGPTAQK